MTPSACDRSRLSPGIVHLGLGNFARAHLAACTEAALHAGAPPHWGILGVSLRHAGVRDALAPRQGRYTLVLRDDQGEHRQEIGCVLGCLVAPEDPVAVLDRMADEATRIVSLTVTEKGYCHDPASGVLNPAHGDIVHDLAHPQAPRSAPGFIVHGLARRRAAGRGGLTLMSLDNLPANGRLLRGVVLALARRIDTALPDWIARHCRFPCSMVDRIVPRTDGELAAEPFFDWAVEDDFAAGRPDWTAGGARFVADAAPWEQRKLRLVNGAHSCIAYLGVAAGWPTVDAAVAQPGMRRFLQTFWHDEVAPTLHSQVEIATTGERLLRRFANPALAHATLQIAMDGSQKLPQRLLGTVRDRLASGDHIDALALGVAAWCQHLRGHDDAGRAYVLDDPLAPALQAWQAMAQALPDDAARAAHFTRFGPVFGDLADAPGLVAALAPALGRLRERGAAATLQAAWP